MRMYGITHKSTKIIAHWQIPLVKFCSTSIKYLALFHNCVNRVSSGSASNAADPCWPLFHFPIGYFGRLSAILLTNYLNVTWKLICPNLFDVVLIAKIFLMFRYNHKLFITSLVIVLIKYFLAKCQIRGSQKNGC